MEIALDWESDLIGPPDDEQQDGSATVPKNTTIGFHRW